MTISVIDILNAKCKKWPFFWLAMSAPFHTHSSPDLETKHYQPSLKCGHFTSSTSLNATCNLHAWTTLHPRPIQSKTSYLVWQTNLWPNHLQSATLKKNYWVSTQHVNYNDTTILRFAVDLPRLRKGLSQHIHVALRLSGFISTYSRAWTWCFQEIDLV